MGKPRRRLSEVEMDKLKPANCQNVRALKEVIEKAIKDRDIKENTVNKLKFRKVPWGSWIMGIFFWSGAAFTVYMIFEELINYKHHA